MLQRLHKIIQPAEEGDILSRVFDILLVALILLSSFNVFWLTFDIPADARLVIERTENVIVLLFSVEFVIRLLTAGYLYPQHKQPVAALRYLFSFGGIIDFLAVVPYWIDPLLPFNLAILRLIRIFRMLRIFKLGSYMDGMGKITSTIRNKRHELLSTFFIIGILLFIASMLIYFFECDAQPDVFDNAGAGLWWAVSTLTTIGYGDVCPITPAGKFMASIIALLGVGIVAIPSGIIAAGLTELDYMEDVSKAAKKAKDRKLSEFAPELSITIDGKTYIAHLAPEEEAPEKDQA